MQASARLKQGGIKVGVWGYYGQEEHDAIDETFDAWVAGVDVTVPLGPSWKLFGEAYLGANAKTVLGGIGNGIGDSDGDTVIDEEIAAAGAWLALGYKGETLSMNLIAGIDTADEDDGAVRTENLALTVNATKKLSEVTSVGLELQHLSTNYAGQDDPSGVRVQASLTMKF